MINWAVLYVWQYELFHTDGFHSVRRWQWIMYTVVREEKG